MLYLQLGRHVALRPNHVVLSLPKDLESFTEILVRVRKLACRKDFKLFTSFRMTVLVVQDDD